MPLSKTEQNVGALISFLAIVLLSVYVLFSTVGFANELVLLPLLGGAVIGSLILSIILLIRYRKRGMIAEIDYLNVGVQRHILGLLMIFYGLPKLFGTFFDYQLFALDSKLGDVSEFELAWYFYGKNRWQELFAGVMEFVPGVLLLNRRTYYTGALILLPVTGQVFVLNFFFKIGGITFPAALILLACNLYIVYSQKEKIVQFFKSLDFTPAVRLGSITTRVIKVCKWTIIVLALVVFYRNIKRNFFRPHDGISYEKLVGGYTLETAKKNGTPYSPANDSLLYKDIYIEKQSRWNILRRYNDKTDAFVMKLNPQNDSIQLFINKNGIGDSPDVLDSLTVLTGVYRVEGDQLMINGIQIGDTLSLQYRKMDIKPKKWFW